MTSGKVTQGGSRITRNPPRQHLSKVAFNAAVERDEAREACVYIHCVQHNGLFHCAVCRATWWADALNYRLHKLPKSRTRAHMQICAAILVGLWYLHFWYCIAIQLSGIQSRVLTLTLTPNLWPRSYIYNIATKQRGPEITQTAE